MAISRFHRRPMAEINVIPYIDVMLVLLVIFMITAPLLSQGVKVELPRVPSQPLEEGADPLIVTVDAAGHYYLSWGATKDTEMDKETLIHRVHAWLQHRPGVPVFVKGDRAAAYGDVVVVMRILKDAGVPSVGLVTESVEPREP
jgi:biopolymer transport protein TolR